MKSPSNDDPGQLPLPFDPLLSVQEIFDLADEATLRRAREDRRIERKPAGISGRSLGDYCSMWANTQPDGGLIVIGQEDDGTFSGCRGITQERLNDLERAPYVFCPDARCDTKRVPVRTALGREDFVLLIRVKYRDDKVVESVSGDAFIRLGASKTKLKPEEVRLLQADKRQVDFEREAVTLKYPDDFDMEIIEDYVAGYRALRGLKEGLTVTEILELGHLGKRGRTHFEPNVACALLFARDPRQLFPGARIRFLRFEGETEGTGARFNSSKDLLIDGPIPLQILEAEKVLDSQLREFARLDKDGKFYVAPEYPKDAWYEAVVNACVHRSYLMRAMPIFVKMFDDRLVIESPGPFPPLVTPENIYDTHNPRNPHLMDAMFYLRYVKCAHEGTRRIRESMASMGLPVPEFQQKEINEALVRVTLRNNIKQRRAWIDSDASMLVDAATAKTLSEDERRALNFCAEHQKVTVTEVMRMTERSWPYAKGVLVGLEKKGIMRHVARPDRIRDKDAHYVLKRKRPPRSK